MATATGGVPVEKRSETISKSWVQLIATGRCPHCGGFMVVEPFVELPEDGEHFALAAHRCVQCGERIDPVILRNRARRSDKKGGGR